MTEGRNPDWRDHACKWLRWALFQLDRHWTSEDACGECGEHFATWVVFTGGIFSSGGVCRTCAIEAGSDPTFECAGRIAYWHKAEATPVTKPTAPWWKKPRRDVVPHVTASATTGETR